MTGEELAALAIALSVVGAPQAEPETARAAAWALAARRPELDLDELRSLVSSNACSTRF
ncbi:MAG: hypothetical protein JO199_09335 [Candidatus Eremiobacteraeota bacterium]|nr:hypothetical protein [Candidatus Eremiobacteraeota bacterium]